MEENAMVNGKGRKMIGIVIPVFNDWESSQPAYPEAERPVSDLRIRFSYLRG